MDSSGVGPAEDTVQALLDYLVDPTLPVKSSGSPSPTQQQLVATQVHAVVLLYNYYHRKEHPWLEFLGFESFCRLAGILKPSLIAHMKLMQESNDAVLEDVGKQLSVTEKAIMDACDIAQSLDASKGVPKTEGWPVSKVSVFLIDSKKENCLLLFSSITQGVWSLIEKDIDFSNDSSEGMEGKYINKRKRIIKKPMRDESNIGESGFLQLAYSAVKGVTGISQSDLLILESHVVYSSSKEKTAARFYIMQCAESINAEIIQIPINDVMDSLQGPLVIQSAFGWMVTPVVEYFHVLPYTEILRDSFSREVLSNRFETPSEDSGNVNVEGYQSMEKPSNTEMNKIGDESYEKSGTFGTNTNGTTAELPKQKDDNGYCTRGLSTAVIGPDNMDEDDTTVDHHQKHTSAPIESDLKASVEMVDSMTLDVTDCNSDRLFHDCQDELPLGDCAPVTCHSNTSSLDKLRSNVDTKDNILSQTALRVLLRKIDKLRHHQRAIEEEIAQCDKTIQRILACSEDEIALKIESIIDGCGAVCLETVSQTEASSSELSERVKRKRLSEATLTMQNPCQELDSICYENNWALPTYIISPKDGGFQADITVKGMDFEYSIGSELHASPCEARVSVAARILAKLKAEKHDKLGVVGIC